MLTNFAIKRAKLFACITAALVAAACASDSTPPGVTGTCQSDNACPVGLRCNTQRQICVAIDAAPLTWPDIGIKSKDGQVALEDAKTDAKNQTCETTKCGPQMTCNTQKQCVCAASYKDCNAAPNDGCECGPNKKCNGTQCVSLCAGVICPGNHTSCNATTGQCECESGYASCQGDPETWGCACPTAAPMSCTCSLQKQCVTSTNTACP